MKKTMKYSLSGLMSAAVITGSAFTASAADVTLSLDGAYTDSQMVVSIYANIDATDGDPLVSGGVKLIYNTGELTSPIAAKNDSVWYFGDGTVAGNHDYVDPDTSTAGEVVFLLGRIDSTETDQAGVSGPDVLLGTVTFTRNTSVVPVADPATLFGLEASLGRDRTVHANYVNFASKAGVDLDSSIPTSVSATYTAPCVLVGDIDANGIVDSIDYNLFRTSYGWTGTPGTNPSDLDSNGIVDSIDYNLFRSNYGQSCP